MCLGTPTASGAQWQQGSKPGKGMRPQDEKMKKAKPGLRPVLCEHLQSGDGKTARDAGREAGEAAQQLTALGALAEDPSMVSNINTVAYNHS